MKNFLINNLIIASLLLVGLIGCKSIHVIREEANELTMTDYDNAAINLVIHGKANELTMTDYDNAAINLINMMLTDAAFQKKLNKMTSALEDGRLPTIVIRSIHNGTTERIQSRLDSMGREIRIRIRKSGLFDLKDDSAAQTMVDRIKWSANSGLESGELLNALKSHVSPHYLMTGEVLHFEDHGYHTFKLYMTLHDISGLSGDGGIIVWEDTCNIVKK